MGAAGLMRYEHWEKRLTAVVGQADRVPFAWGRADCALFAADCVWALTQKDPAAAWRGTYEDESGAARIIAAAGGLAGLVEQGLAAIGVPVQRVAPSFGQRGDPVLFEGALGPTLGVIYGTGFVARGPRGLVTLPVMVTGAVAWAVR